MKKIAIIIFTFLSFTAFGQKSMDFTQASMTLDKWTEEAKTNIRLLPKYGNVTKSVEQKTADSAFVTSTLAHFTTKREASDHMIELGFKYLYKDIKTAMYRFNQAYLLDSTNTDIYWGYGGVYMALGDYKTAKRLYKEGLAINPRNTHILTDYGTCFMTQFYDVPANAVSSDKEKYMVEAIKFLTQSYEIDDKDPNTTFKLSVCYYLKRDCKNAWRFYKLCKSVGGQPITEEYTKALVTLCGGKS